jgi:hypothetical protein
VSRPNFNFLWRAASGLSPHRDFLLKSIGIIVSSHLIGSEMMRVALSLAALLSSAAVTLPSAQAESVKGVVELFTSQGCSSCPPADKVFGEVIDENGVIGLAWHVDYWDYLGWKDTFSSHAATERQRAYASGIGERGVYTPQIIVNGDTVAKNSSFRQSIALALSGSLPVTLDAKVTDGSLVVTAGDGEGSANLVLVTYDSSQNVPIERGENAGSTVNYRHAVQGVQTIGMWKGKSLTVELPGSEYAPKKGQGCAILLQKVSNGAPGSILGAVIVKHPGV